MSKIKIPCSECGAEIWRSRSSLRENNFCDQKCYGAWRSKNIRADNHNRWTERHKVICAGCGKELIRKNWQLKKSKNQFCDRECFYEWKRRQDSGREKSPRWTGRQKVPCASCGKELIRKNWQLKKNKNQFCDRECQHRWQREHGPRGKDVHNWGGGPVTIECSWCGVEIQRERWQLKRGKGHFFCCRKHFGKWYAIYTKGDNSPNWRGGYQDNYGPNWHEQRAHARQRDRYHCRICGLSQDALPRELDVHHIVAFREFRYVPGENDHYLRANRLSNLVSLCPECHGRANYMTPADLHLRLIAL